MILPSAVSPSRDYAECHSTDVQATALPGRCGWRIVNLPYNSSCYYAAMRDFLILRVHAIATLARLLGPGGVRSVVAESVLVKHQLLILNRSRHRAPKLRAPDRFVAGLCSLFMRPTRLIRSGIVLKPSTLLHLHHALIRRKYCMLFSQKRVRRPGPKGPSRELINAIVDMKQRNPTWGCPRIAQQIALAFGVPINKDIVRRVLARHYKPGADCCGPSWLTFLGQIKTVCGAWICFAASRQRCALTGFWWSWINSLAGSLALVCMPELSMVWLSAGCSIAPSEAASPCRST